MFTNKVEAGGRAGSDRTAFEHDLPVRFNRKSSRGHRLVKAAHREDKLLSRITWGVLFRATLFQVDYPALTLILRVIALVALGR